MVPLLFAVLVFAGLCWNVTPANSEGHLYTNISEIAHICDVDVVEEESRDADVGRDDEEDENENTEEPSLFHHH